MSRYEFKFHLKCLCFLLFFVLFLPFTGDLITAQAKETTTIDDTLPVKEIVPEAKLNVKSKELVKGKSYTLKVYNTTESQTVSYKSSDPSVATVTQKGVVGGADIGSAVITVTVKEGSKTISTLQCDITVGVPAIYVKFTKNDLVMVSGQRTTLKYLIAPYNTVEAPKLTTLNSKLVTISTGGRITAKDVGTTYVKGWIDNGYTTLCKVTVISEETYQKLVESGITDLSTITSEDLMNVLPASGGAIKVSSGSALEITTTPGATIIPTETPQESNTIIEE